VFESIAVGVYGIGEGTSVIETGGVSGVDSFWVSGTTDDVGEGKTGEANIVSVCNGDGDWVGLGTVVATKFEVHEIRNTVTPIPTNNF
jgi:hypothetical protein